MQEKIESLSLKNDYVFKRIFGKKGNERITKSLIEEIIQEKIDKIEIQTDVVTERNLVDDKIGILDIKALTNQNSVINIEMQMVNNNNIVQRILFYLNRIYGEEIKVGEDYIKAKRAIVILITNFNISFLKELDQYCSKWEIKNSKVDFVLTDLMGIYIIELPKVLKEKESSMLIKWLRFLENPENVEVTEMSEEMKEAKDVLNEISQDEEERYLAYLREKYVLEMNSFKHEGYDEGLEKGRQEGRKEIAKKLLKLDLTIEKISEVTGLSKEEIEALEG